MRIFSKFHDYYDTSLGYGIDPNIIYNRKTIKYCENEIPLKLFENHNITLGSRREQLDLILASLGPIQKNSQGKEFEKRIKIENKSMISFCSQIVTFLTVCIDYDKEYIYSKEELEEFFQNNLDKRDFKKLTEKSMGKFKDKNSNLDRISKFFDNETCRLSHDQLTEWHRYFESPVFVYYLNHRGWDEFEVDSELKKLKFYKVKDAFTAFQEISMFLGNIIGKKGNETVEISDKIRAEQHGFNEESFRKSPTKKKK